MHKAPDLTPVRQAEQAASADKRLAEALRANLRRRKEQARAREDATPGDSDEGEKRGLAAGARPQASATSGSASGGVERQPALQ